MGTSQRRSRSERIVIEHAIADAVWRGEIDQMYTREVAEQYGLSVGVTRRILQRIVNGESSDVRFVWDPTNSGVVVESGATFVRDDGGKGSGDGPAHGMGLNHICWFLT